MRLRTEMMPRTEGMGPWEKSGHSAQDLFHDAMAAHALLQAMGEADEQDGNVSGQWGSCIEQIRLRAAEILAGWLREECNGN